jgi:hypothetical protein
MHTADWRCTFSCFVGGMSIVQQVKPSRQPNVEGRSHERLIRCVRQNETSTSMGLFWGLPL